MKHLYLFVSLVFVFSSHAEFRIWESKSGNIWEAEFVTMKGNLVLLRDQAGNDKEYDLPNFVETDLDYLDEMLPPKLNVDVSKTTDDAGSSSTTKVICNTTIKQSDTRKYDGPLTLVLLVMGEDVRTGSLTTASRTEESFTLPDEWGKAVKVSSRKTSLYKSNADRGRIYSGYIAVIWDRFGNPIVVETNKPGLEERAEKLAYVSLKNRKIKKL